MQRQYERPDTPIPRFAELKFVKTPNAIGSSIPDGYVGKTWAHALTDIKKAIDAAGDFDVALLSCGAYGMSYPAPYSGLPYTRPYTLVPCPIPYPTQSSLSLSLSLSLSSSLFLGLFNIDSALLYIHH